jgi:hypothetical protein
MAAIRQLTFCQPVLKAKLECDKPHMGSLLLLADQTEEAHELLQLP